MEMAGFSSPVPPIPSHPPLFVFHCRGYQLLAANKDDKDEEDVRGEETLPMMANHIKPLLAVKWECWGLPRVLQRGVGLHYHVADLLGQDDFCIFGL